MLKFKVKVVAIGLRPIADTDINWVWHPILTPILGCKRGENMSWKLKFNINTWLEVKNYYI